MIIKFLTFLGPLIIGILSYKYTSHSMARRLIANSSTCKDPLLNTLVKKIARTLSIQQVPLNILEEKILNGLVSPDGKIFITRGFLDKYYAGEISSEELIGVVAHEVGHLALGHTKKRMITYTTNSALQLGLSIALARFLPFVGNYISAFLVKLITSKLSRSDEYQADEYAAALMTKIGLGTEPLINLFQKLEALGSQNQKVPIWFQSHPSPAERIKAIKDLKIKWEGIS